MPPIRKLAFLAALLALAAAAPSQAAPRTFTVGASESASLVPDSVVAKARMDLAVLAGFTEIEVRAGWTPGKTEPTAEELASFQASALAAQLDAVRLVIAVDTGGSLQTPSSLFDRKQFAQYTAALARSLPYVRDFIVGNEPNLNRFWMPQFERGRDAAAPAYEALLARTYDALKAVSPSINVIGGALAQRGASLPILYGEYGVQTRVPAGKLGAYTNLSVPSATDAVSQTMQAAYYKQAIQLAYCQPTVSGLLFFHVSDEPDLDRWQSGLFYADDTPKSSLAAVRTAAQAAQTGTLSCPKAKPKQRQRRR